ncbi:MAG TPA: response regulator [Gammaproteobacteria bacterium]|nr:response regulator [Gammaproteobacteria bacterium]
MLPAEIEIPSRAHKILIVDDNPAAADTLTEMLGLYGNEVQAVHNGQAALKTFEAWQSNVILLDIGMPGMDSYEVARRVRQQAAQHEVMLIALAGWAQSEDKRRAQQVGIDIHLSKPVDLVAPKNILADIKPAIR